MRTTRIPLAGIDGITSMTGIESAAPRTHRACMINSQIPKAEGHSAEGWVGGCVYYDGSALRVMVGSESLITVPT